MSSLRGPSHVRRAYANGSFGQIHYRRSGPEGTRSPLLLLHSLPGASYLFESFMAEMGNDRTVIAPDFPGFGMSDAPAMAPGITGYAAALRELETELGLGVFDIMGYHAGSAVGAELARQQPEALRKLIMVGAPIFTAKEREEFNERFSVFGPDERAKHFEKNWQMFKANFWKMEKDAERSWYIYVDNQKNPSGLAWGLRAAISYDLESTMKEITQPLLVLNPADDLASYTPRAAGIMKNGSLKDLPEWTHGMFDAKTTELSTLVRAFLDG